MGTILASTIITSIARTLQDSGYDHWTQAEMLEYLNDAQREIVLLKPNANVTNGNQVLVAGTKQTLPTGGIQLIKIVRNMGTGGTTPGTAIRLVRDMDAYNILNPDWHTDTESATVQRYFFDEQDPASFYVSPPQPSSGFGYVNMVYSTAPTDIASTSTAISLDDIYATPMYHYGLFRTYLKDSGSSENAWVRAQQNREMYLSLIGRKDVAEQIYRPQADSGAK